MFKVWKNLRAMKWILIDHASCIVSWYHEWKYVFAITKTSDPSDIIKMIVGICFYNETHILNHLITAYNRKNITMMTLII